MNFWRTRDRDGDDLLFEWAMLTKTLWVRLYRPIFEPAYLIFFVLSMAIGATGIWVAIAETWLTESSKTLYDSIWADPSVFKSVITFFAALGSLSCIKVIVVEDRQKNLRAFLCLLLVAFIIIAVIAALTESVASGAGIPYLIGGTLLALVTWWIANWDETKFVQTDSNAAMGGDTEVPPAGDTKGFSL